jgi:hypothetical protein
MTKDEAIGVLALCLPWLASPPRICRGWCPQQLHSDAFRWRSRQQHLKVGEDADSPFSLMVGGDANHGK